MLCFRRTACLKLGCAIIYLALISRYLYQCRNPRLQQINYEPAKYQSEATYEYTSTYRLLADRVFEESLEKQLIALERASRVTDVEPLPADRNIWQIASPSEKRFWLAWTNQWKKMNPEWKYRLLVTPPEDLLKVFRAIPDVGHALKKYAPIRRDLVRHLLLWYYGGLYSNIDTWSRISLLTCAPIATAMEKRMNISLMIGVEIDEPFLSQETMRKWGWSRNFGFSQDVIWAPQRFDPILRKAIVRSISHARIHEMVGGTPSFDADMGRQILGEISGPAMFTDIVLETLNERLSYDNYLRDWDAGIARRVNWKKFNRLRYTVWIEHQNTSAGHTTPGLAILPINIWANGQNHSRAGLESNDEACVNQLRLTSKKNWWEATFS